MINLPTKKIFYKDQFELVSFRHRCFSRAEKKTFDYLKVHQTILTQEAYRFFYQKKKLCQSAGYEISDVLSYCRIWCVNLFGQLFKDALQKPISEQEKILRFYLKQEFGRFAHLLFKKNQRIVLETNEEFTDLFDPHNSNEDRDLSKIPHRVFFERWNKILKKPWVDKETKELALKLLDDHQSKCKVCHRMNIHVSNIPS